MEEALIAPKCVVHEERLQGIEKRLDEHGQQLKEHNQIYMRFLEKLTEMNGNLINLTKVETENSTHIAESNERIRDLTGMIKEHIEHTTCATKELSDKQEEQFKELRASKLDKQEYDKQNEKKRDYKKIFFGSALGIVLTVCAKLILNYFGIGTPL